MQEFAVIVPQLSGFILPPIIEILNKDVTDDRYRFIVSMLICLVVAFFVKFDSINTGNYSDLVTSFGIIFAESQVVFKLYFKESFLRTVMIDRLHSVDVPVG